MGIRSRTENSAENLAARSGRAGVVGGIAAGGGGRLEVLGLSRPPLVLGQFGVYDCVLCPLGGVCRLPGVERNELRYTAAQADFDVLGGLGHWLPSSVEPSRCQWPAPLRAAPASAASEVVGT